MEIWVLLVGMPTLAVVTLEHTSLLPKDRYVNNWVIDADRPAIGTDESLYADAIADFYTTAVGSNAVPLSNYIGNQVSRVASAHRVKLYDIAGFLDGSPHGSPYYEYAFTMPSASSTDLPAQLAVKVTFEAEGRAVAAVETPDDADADSLVNRPKARRTGGIYFGPLNGGTQGAAGASVRPASTFVTQILEAVRGTHDRIDALNVDSNGLGVWSRVDEAVRPLEAVSCDNSYDVIRRRKLAASSRTRVTL